MVDQVRGVPDKESWCPFLQFPRTGGQIVCTILLIQFVADTMVSLYILYSSKLLRDKIFVKINFADQGFLLAMPFLAATCTICVYSCKYAMLGCLLPSLSILFRGQLRLRSSWFRFVGAYQLLVPGQRHFPINKCNGCWRNLQKWPPGIQKCWLWNNSGEPCCSWCPSDGAKVE